MKKIFQKNQVILTALAIMIAIAGYLNFTQEDADYTASESVESISPDDSEEKDVLYDISEEDILNENSAKSALSAQTDSNNGDKEKDKDSAKKKKSDAKETVSKGDNKSSIGEAILVNSTISLDTIYSVKLNREQERAKNKETLLSVVEDEKASQDMKDKALNEIIEITSNAEKELSAETLLAAKGYDNCVVSISEDSTDVIVDVKSISSEDAAVIMDVVKRKTGTQSSKIVITPVNSESDGSKEQ